MIEIIKTTDKQFPYLLKGVGNKDQKFTELALKELYSSIVKVWSFDK